MSDPVWSSRTREARGKSVWLPVLVGLLLCTIVLVLTWTLQHQEQTILSDRVRSEANLLASRIDADLRNRLPALQRMAVRWEIHQGTPPGEFESDAYSYLSDVPGFQAIEWVDASSLVRRVIPLEGNEKALNLNLAFEGNRKLAMERSRRTRAPSATSPIDLVQGGKGFLVFFPTFIRDRFQGHILAVFRIRQWLDYVFEVRERPDQREDFRICVFYDDVPVYGLEGWETLPETEEAVASVAMVDHRLFVHVRPTRAFLENGRSRLPVLAALFGFLMSVLVALVIRMYQKTDAARACEAREALEKEVSGHRRTADELQQALSRLDLATKAGRIGVWTWDVPSGMLVWNERMHELFDLPTDVRPTYELWRRLIHREDEPATVALLKNAIRGTASFQTEYRAVLASGEIRYLQAAARVERDSDGKALRMTGVKRDITQLKMTEATLRKSEAQVRLLLNSTAEAIYGLDLEGRCTFANPSCLRMLGYGGLDQVLGRNMHDLIHHSHSDGTSFPVEECSIFRAFQEGKGMHRDDEVLWRVDGTSFPAEYWSFPQIDGDRTIGSVVTFIDITQRRRAEELLVKERQRLADILEGTNVGTWEWNVQTGEVIFNERWAAILGYTLSELEPVSIDTWMKVAHPDDLKVSGEKLEKHFRKETAYYECEARMRHKKGHWVWVLDRGKVAIWTKDEKPLVMSGTHQDITERKASEEQILHLASHDTLTDLPSLRLAKDRLTMALGQARRYGKMAAVLFMDLDGFKTVNDTLGHDAGDHVLKEVARRMVAGVRETDTVARVGGDEFLIVLTELQSPDNASALAEKVIELVSRPISFQNRKVTVGVSIGIAMFPGDGSNIDRLVKLADEAMYEVKKAGKNRYRFVAT